MSDASARKPFLERFYQQYLEQQQTATFIMQVSATYTVGTLERLVRRGSRTTRRAAALALGLIGDYQSNAVLGEALNDVDRGVRTFAENALRTVWRRIGNDEQQRLLEAAIRANGARHFLAAIARAAELLDDAPWFAEAWNQRAIGYYGCGLFHESIADCHQALDINPYHFGAAAGIGQCYLQLGRRQLALESFRRALRLNPNLEGIRAQVAALERTTGKK
ncbi:MAG TPA: tetratricopeptide repeat protein [Pirellulales bacterium]|nr:tetratricopeptide repeat protein [Pirellulales bacterium]